MITTLGQIKPFIPMLLDAGICPFIHSSPGIGKSAFARQVAKDMNLKFIDIRLSDMEPSDIVGLPAFVDGRAHFTPFTTFPIDTDTIPDGYDGWLIMLDEFSSGNQSVQAACYKLILDRQVGQYDLHPKAFLMAAGNLETDNAIVNPMGSALISRFAHFYVETSHKEWMEWASGNLDIRVTSFIGRFPRHLNTFDADASKPYSCQRTFHMLSDAINGRKIDTSFMPLVSSLIGEGIANEFIAFSSLYADLPDFQSIVDNPDTVEVSDNMSIRWAIMGLISHSIDEENAKQCATYLKRLPTELQVCALRQIKAHKPDLLYNEISDWALEVAKKIF